MSNCTMGDFAAANLACALENNKTLEKLSIESNNVSPQTLVKIFEVRRIPKTRLRTYFVWTVLKLVTYHNRFQAANVQQTLRDIKASNQQAQFLGNKVEVAITNAVEKNKTLLRVGLHFEFGDCR